MRLKFWSSNAHPIVRGLDYYRCIEEVALPLYARSSDWRREDNHAIVLFLAGNADSDDGNYFEVDEKGEVFLSFRDEFNKIHVISLFIIVHYYIILDL